MITQWFTFGQCHAHAHAGVTFDKDLVVEITAEDPRSVMFGLFGNKWGMQYDSKPDMRHYPRGIYKLKLD